MPILYSAVFKDNEFVFGKPDNQKAQKVVEAVNPKLSGQELQTSISINNDKWIHAKRYKDSESQEFITIFCLATEDVEKRIVWKFVEKSKECYETGTLTSKYLKKLVSDFNLPDVDQIHVLQEKVDEIKEIMIMNIDKLIERGEKLEEIVQMTEELNEEATGFLSGSKKVRNSMIKKFILYIVILVFLLLGILITVFFVACGFPYFDKCFFTKK